ncbi:MAG: LAGLIDADG family homing endonuclease [Candidatus Hodarchaeota archaeon]
MCPESDKATFAYLIGALADGSIYHSRKHYVYRVTYYQHSQDYLLKCIESCIMRLFDKKGHFYYDTRRDVYFYEITSKEVYQYYEQAIESFKVDIDRHVPLWIKCSDTSVKFAFIRGFFDADGFYYFVPEKSDYRVRFGQSEYYILEDIREILSEEFKCSDVLGPYQSKIGVKPYYELHIYGSNQVYKFRDLIKPCHPDKQLDLLF